MNNSSLSYIINGMELWQKLRDLRKRANMTLTEVAKAMPGNVSRVAVGYWESQNPDNRTEPRTANRKALAKLYGVSVAELMDDSKAAATNPHEMQLKLIPVIDIIQAGESAVFADAYSPGDADDWIPAMGNVSEGTFALKVKGTSMEQSGKEPSYPDGSYVICDPTLAGDENIGDGVIARILETDLRVFKSLDSIDGRPVLSPLNKQHPIITDEFEVLAVVTQSIIKRR